MTRYPHERDPVGQYPVLGLPARSPCHEICESVLSFPAVESLRWPDEDERLTFGTVEGAGELPCACHLTDVGMQALLAEEFYSLVSK
ncbi:hypothetical protein [Halomonas sp. WWR20]